MAPRDLLTSLLTTPVASKLVSLTTPPPPPFTRHPTRMILPQHTFTPLSCSRASSSFLLPHTTHFHNLCCNFPTFPNSLARFSSFLPIPPSLISLSLSLLYFYDFDCDLQGMSSHCLGSLSPFSVRSTLQGRLFCPSTKPFLVACVLRILSLMNSYLPYINSTQLSHQPGP